MQGFLYSVNRAHPVDLTMLAETISMSGHFWMVRLSAKIVSLLVAYIQGDSSIIRAELPAILKLSVQKSSLPDMLVCLTVIAMLMVDDGEYTYAAELMGLILNHPGCPHGWFDQWILLIDKQAVLQAKLGTEKWQEAQEQGKKRVVR